MMKKIVNPCMCSVGKRRARAFVRIEYSADGRLSLSGVIGPLASGNCLGSCGQCVDTIRAGDPVGEWTPQMLRKLCNVWDRRRLNDMRPCCEHQRQLEWDKLAEKKVTLYRYRLKDEIVQKQKAAERAALDALKGGETFTPDEEMVRLASLPYTVTSHQPLEGEDASYYELRTPIYPGDNGPTETKTLGWLTPEEHPDGLFGRACPVCGYRYGHGWQKEDVPKEVIDWLRRRLCMKEKFIELYNQYITRPGAEELLRWITASDFFTAPASTHLSRPGGLVEHSVHVYDRLRALCDAEVQAASGFVRSSDETIADLEATYLDEGER